MKKVIVLMGLFIAGFSFANAQAQKSELKQEQTKNADLDSKAKAYLERQEKKAAEFDEVVGLSDSQKLKIKEISDNANLKMKAVVDKYPEKTEERKVEIRTIEKERNKQVMSVLTKEQQEKWNTYVQAKKEADHSGHDHPHPHK